MKKSEHTVDINVSGEWWIRGNKYLWGQVTNGTVLLLTKEVTLKFNGTFLMSANLKSKDIIVGNKVIQSEEKLDKSPTYKTSQRKLVLNEELTKRWGNFFDTNRL